MAELANAHDQDMSPYREIMPRDLSIEDRIEFVGRLAVFAHGVLATILKKQAADEAAKPITAPHEAAVR